MGILIDTAFLRFKHINQKANACLKMKISSLLWNLHIILTFWMADKLPTTGDIKHFLRLGTQTFF